MPLDRSDVSGSLPTGPWAGAPRAQVRAAVDVLFETDESAYYLT